MEARFRVLGTLEVWARGELVRVGGRVPVRTLALLLLEANRVVPVPRLVDAAWDDEPPRSAPHQIRKAVALLRERIPGGAKLILTDGPGYRAAVPAERIDLGRYQARLRAGREAIRQGRPDLAATELTAALELWRGPVLAGAGGAAIEALSVALEEQHLAATEQLFELRLAASEGGEVIAELRGLTHRNPLRETLRGQLMLALYQAGRQAEALAEYGRIRELLADELGIDPSARLTALYKDILRQRDGLTGTRRPPPVSEPGASAGFPVPRMLPYDLRDFTGRTTELKQVSEAAADAHIIAIGGMGGSGKTALAVRAAHQLAPQYPDGQLFVDLCGFTPGRRELTPFDANEQLLAAMGHSSERIPRAQAARAALWRSVTEQRRLLVVLDNAAGSEQVRPLIPSSPSCLTLVTSQVRLVDLDGAVLLSLPAMPESDCMELLRHTLGGERLAREQEATRELVRLCGWLPLAVRIAAGRLRNRPSWTVQHLVSRLRDEARRLAELRAGGRSVAGVLQLSYDSMTPQQQTCLRVLGLHPGKAIDLQEADALVGTDPFEAEILLETMLGIHLLEEPRPGWYRFHDLVRSFAHGLAGPATAEEDERAVRRLLDHYVTTAERAERRWFDDHRDSLLGAVRLAYDRGLLWHAAYLPRELGFHSEVRDSPQESYAAQQIAVKASRELADPVALRLNLTNLAMDQWSLGMFRDGIASLEEALALAKSQSDRYGEAACLGRLGRIYHSLGELCTALRFTQQAAELEQALGLVRERGASLTVLAEVLVWLGRFQDAVDSGQEAAARLAEIGERRLRALALCWLGLALVGLGHTQPALARLAEALAAVGSVGGVDAAFVLAHAAAMSARAGEHDQARARAEAAVANIGYGEATVRHAAVENALGRAYRALAELAEAREHHQLAADLAAGMAFRSEEAPALAGLAEVHERLGKPAAAATYRRRADELYQRMGVPDPVRRLL